MPVFQPIFGKGLWAASWPVKCHRAPRPNFRASGGGPPVLVRAAAAPMTSDYVIDSDDEAELRSASTPIGLEQHLGAAHLFGPLRPLRWAMANSARATAHGARTLTALSSRIGRRRTRRRRLIRRSRLLAVDDLKSPRKLKGGRVDDCGDGARRSVLHPVVGWTGSNAVAFRARNRAHVPPRSPHLCPKAVAFLVSRPGSRVRGRSLSLDSNPLPSPHPPAPCGRCSHQGAAAVPPPVAVAPSAAAARTPSSPRRRRHSRRRAVAAAPPLSQPRRRPAAAAAPAAPARVRAPACHCVPAPARAAARRGRGLCAV